MVGGYAVIDLNGADFVGTNTLYIAGIYDKLEALVGKKPILIRNFRRGGVEQIPQYCGAYHGTDSTFSLFLYSVGYAANSISITANNYARWAISVPPVSSTQDA